MNAQTTLDAVRELSERAMLRPAPRQLHLASKATGPARPRVIIPWEERFAVKIGGRQGTAGNYKPRTFKPKTEHVTRKALEKDFLREAADKSEAAMERRVVVVPAGF